MALIGTIGAGASVANTSLSGVITTTQLANNVITHTKMSDVETWSSTSSNGTGCTFYRLPVGNNRFYWYMSMDSVNSGSYINLPSGTGSAGTSLGTWWSSYWPGSGQGVIIYGDCHRVRRYSWHSSEAQRSFSGFNYVSDGGSGLYINRFNHGLGGVDAIFTMFFLSLGQ